MFLHRVRLFSLAGFTVWVDVSWLIFAVMLVWSLAIGIFRRSPRHCRRPTYWWMAVAGTIGLFFSIVFHEPRTRWSRGILRCDLRHHAVHLRRRRELHQEPTSAREEFLMAVAGPIASMVLGTAFLAVVALGGGELPLPVRGVLCTWAISTGCWRSLISYRPSA